MIQTPLEDAIEKSQKLRPRTKKIYLEAVRSFVAYAGRDPKKWNGMAVEKWREDRLTRVKPQSANLYLAGLRYACKRTAALTGDPRYDFARAVESSRVEQSKKRRALTEEQVFALLDTCERGTPSDLRDAAIITLGVRTGLRRDGMSNLRFEDCENNKAITVTLKGGRRHTIYPDSVCWEALGAWKRWLESAGVKEGRLFRAIGRERIDRSFQVGKSLSPDGIYGTLRNRAKEAGVKNVSPHVLRHTFVSWCKQMGVPDFRIQAMTGHRSTSMLQTYTTDLEAENQPVGEALPWRR